MSPPMLQHPDEVWPPPRHSADGLGAGTGMRGAGSFKHSDPQVEWLNRSFVLRIELPNTWDRRLPTPATLQAHCPHLHKLLNKQSTCSPSDTSTCA